MNMKFSSLSVPAAVLLACLVPGGEAEACTNILVTKGASADGSCMISYAADSHTLFGELYFQPASRHENGEMLGIYEWDTGKYLGEIPQVPYTYQTVGNMNEHQLIIAETTYGGRPELFDSTGIMDYGSLIYVTLQRARTAREAIETIADLADTYGYCSSGESFSIADKDEVWVMDLIGKGYKAGKDGNERKGIVWVARRVPDGYICGHANQARISTFPLDDKENCMYSPDVISFAREMGYFNGRDEDFSFCDAYNPLNFGGMRGCEARVWAAFNILCDGRFAFEDENGEVENIFEDDVPYDLKAPVVEIAKEDYGIWYVDMMEHPDRYKGKVVEFTAKVVKPRAFPSKVFLPGRMAMTCCADDTTFLGYVCKSPYAPKLKPGDWIKIRAKVGFAKVSVYRGEGPVLEAEHIELADPIEELVYFN